MCVVGLVLLYKVARRAFFVLACVVILVLAFVVYLRITYDSCRIIGSGIHLTRRPSPNNPAEVAERNGVSVLDATTGGAELYVMCCGCALTTRNMRLESIPIAILALLPLGVDAAEAVFLMLGGISWRELILVALDLLMVGVFIVPWACKCRRCCTFEAMELNISLFSRMFNMGYEEERGASGGSRRVEVSQCWCR